MSENISFSERLLQLVEYTGLNQNQIAKKSGVSPSSFGKAIKGASLSIENAVKIIEEFDIDANWLLLGVGTPKKKDLCFSNNTEIVSHIVDHPESFKKLSSFRELMQDLLVDERLDGMEREMKSLKEKFDKLLRNGNA